MGLLHGIKETALKRMGDWDKQRTERRLRDQAIYDATYKEFYNTARDRKAFDRAVRDACKKANAPSVKDKLISALDNMSKGAADDFERRARSIGEEEKKRYQEYIR